MIGALILAAGFSQRFGSDKRLYRRAPGKPPMLVETLEKYADAFDMCFVVVRLDDGEVAQLIEANFGNKVRILMSEDSSLGMGASLACGVRHIIAEHSELQALFVGHGDMPFVRTGTLQRLREIMGGLSHAILRPEFNGVPGHPVGFAHEFLNEISRLTGDAGAKTVLESHPNAVRSFDFEDPGVCLDLDTSR